MPQSAFFWCCHPDQKLIAREKKKRKREKRKGKERKEKGKEKRKRRGKSSKYCSST